MKIWGRDPVHIIARYKSGGQELTSLLLADGWWGLARHFHYIPEIAASFFWCLPAMNQAIFPYFYPVYLTLLLLDRAWRDDARCAEKYKASWVEYCQKVPSKIIPGII
jgi:7-dehydrocholesterol reductase